MEPSYQKPRGGLTRVCLSVLIAATLLARVSALPFPWPRVVQVNFESDEAPSCEGKFLRDTGEPLSSRPGGFRYGWVSASSKEKTEARTFTRDNPARSCIENSFARLQPKYWTSWRNNSAKQVDWVFVLPNGKYRVTAMMGDEVMRSTYYLIERGTKKVLLPITEPTMRYQYFTGSSEIRVKNGKLRLGAVQHGFDAKLNFVRIERLRGAQVDVDPVPGKGPCVPNPSQFDGKIISPLRCEDVQIETPYRLHFDGKHGGIKDSRGRGTGLTMYLPSRKVKKYYERQRVQLQPPKRRMRLFAHVGSPEGDSDNARNLLGVGLPVPGQDLRLEVTVQVPVVESARERFCLYVAVSDSEFAFLCVEKDSDFDGHRARVYYEVMNVKRFSEVKFIRLGAERVVSLRMDVRPSSDEIDCSIRIQGGIWMRVAILDIDPFTLNKDGANTDQAVGTRTHGGMTALLRGTKNPRTKVKFFVTQFDVTEIPSPLDTGSGSPNVDFNTWHVPGVMEPTAMVWAGDKLWISTASGCVQSLKFNGVRTSLVSRRELCPIGTRLLLGITADPDFAANKCLWLSHSSPSRREGEANSGIITRVCGDDLSMRTDVIKGLPRAIANHATNNIDFQNGKLYIAVGGNTASGGPCAEGVNQFGGRPEQPLSGGILEADVFANDFNGDCTPLQDPTDMDETGIAAKEVPTCGVRVYATGTRNVFDCVWHSNGKLYCPDNGVGGRSCIPKLRPGYTFGDSCDVMSATDPGVRDDPLYLIQEGKYYGHPNPSRMECVMGGGNPTSGPDSRVPLMPIPLAGTVAWEVPEYPTQRAPHPNFQKPIASFGKNRSPNSIIEYKSNRMCGELRRELLVTWFSVGRQVRRVKLSGDGTRVISDSVLRRTTVSSGGPGMDQPLGIAEDQDGNLFVGEFGANRVTVLNPLDGPC